MAPPLRKEMLGLPSDPRSAAAARDFVVDNLLAWGEDEYLETAVLLVSELVTNAVLHAQSDSEVRLVLYEDSLRVEVSDRNPIRPHLLEADPSRPSGRGMMLVEALAARWGSDIGEDGKSVWFELRR